MTSSCFEASPLVCLEAMFMAGIPSIVPETCGAISYIQDGVNGLWFKNNDVDSLCSAIQRMEGWRFYAQLRHNINDALPALRSDRSYGRYAERVVDLYEGLLDD